MTSIIELTSYIRFQLKELSSLNKHHEFEHLAKHVARLRVCENILPATGPVGSGGDQGRDFETYRSYLASTPLALSTFLGISHDKKIVFSCSIQEKIIPKIKSDLQKICGNDTKVDVVYYFCTANVPVSKRHELQKTAREHYQVELEIFDGQALADILATTDLFWIAAEYLSVPAEMFPKSAVSSSIYQEYKERWLNTELKPQSYADFFQIKYGLRTTTFSKDERPDILFWVKKMEIFLSKDIFSDLRRRAIYEVAVASLRGMDNLTSQKERIEEYFLNINEFWEMAELEDATSLLTYCSAACKTGHFQINESILVSWIIALINRVEILLKTTTASDRRAYLLMIRGNLATIKYSISSLGKFDLKEIFKWWNRVIGEAKKAVLFPLERFSDLLSLFTVHAGDNPQFIALTSQVDELLIKRAGEFIAAEKCRDRAISHYDAGKYILAIKQLQKSKVHWFSSETLQGSIFAMLFISQCYEKLGLTYAAKYYAAIAIYMINRQNEDKLKNILSQACFRLASCCYVSGEWMAFIEVMYLSLLAHIHYDANPLDFNLHDELPVHFSHLTIVRTLSKRFLPSISELIECKIKKWPMDQALYNSLNELVQNKESRWWKDSIEVLWKEAEEELAGRPFCDLGAVRKIEWKALGIEWLVEFKNEHMANAIAEEFVAIFQIILADLAVYDLCLLPTRVKIICKIYDGVKIVIEEVPDNTISTWDICFPRAWINNYSNKDEVESYILPLAISILNICSVLPDEEFMKKFDLAIKDGLLQKTFFVRPYSECYHQIMMPETTFNLLNRTMYQPLNSEQKFQINEHKELAWHDEKGPGYSKKKAERFLKNRYSESIKSIRLTLSKLLDSAESIDAIRNLKAEGYLDWQILLIFMNLALNYRVKKMGGINQNIKSQIELSWKNIHHEETNDDIEVPLNVFSADAIDMQKNFLAARVAKTWELVVKQKTPDFQAIKKLLDIKYNNSVDDIEHESYWNDL